jgi:hypothetical protein
MSRMIGRDVSGNAVSFVVDGQNVEADAVTTAEAAIKSGSATTAGTITGTQGALTVTGLLTSTGGLIPGTPTAITAGTTQTLAGATALKPVSVVNAANANDGVKLPASTGSGINYLVITIGSTATPKIWPQAADAIDASSAGTAVTLTAAHRAALFIDTAVNQWRSFLLGAIAS